MGLDDGWQDCSAGEGTYHRADGTPAVDSQRFPDLKALVDYAHSLNLTAGWYGNNCGCEEHQRVPSWGAPASTAARSSSSSSKEAEGSAAEAAAGAHAHVAAHVPPSLTCATASSAASARRPGRSSAPT